MRLTHTILIATLCCLAVLGKITINSATRTFRDQQGRARIFHGTNVVMKIAPYVPMQDKFDPHMSLSDIDIQDMKDWGITLVRLGVMWESVETAPLVYNYTYMAEVLKLVNKLGQNGIYTMIDAHQDLFSRKTCGEGMPAFYANDLEDYCPMNIPGFFFKLFGACTPMKDYGFRYDENGLPLVEDCLKHSFMKYYTAPEVCSSFEQFYNNATILDRFVAHWDVVSKYLAGNQYIIGYDPINEPWPANFYKDFSLLYSQTKFSTEILFPIMKRVHDVIRKNVEDMNYFFETSQFPDTFPMFGGIVAPLAWNDTPGGSKYLANQVLNDHTYCCQESQDMCITGEPPLESKDVCKAFHENKVKVRASDAQKFGVPLVFSEFGACANTEACLNEITSATDAFDEHLASWMYWMFKGFGDFTTTGSLTEGMYDKDGTLQIYKVLGLQRTFIHAFQGTPLNMKFMTQGADNGTFSAQFTLDTSINAPTEIFFNEAVYYPKGYKLSVLIDKLAPESFTVDKSQKNYLKFQLANTVNNGKTVSVVLTPILQETDKIVYQNDVKLSYHIDEQKDDLKGIVYFKVNGVQDLGNAAQFEIIGTDGSVICQGKQNQHQCFTFNHLAYKVKINVFRQGWFGNNYLVQTELNKLNGHVITFNIGQEKKAPEFIQ